MGNKWFGDRGASLVELALALPLLMMLLVGMVSAGIAYNNQLSLTHAAREGGRYGATLPVDPGAMNAWLTAVSDQVIADATGALDDGVDGRYVCVAYVHPNGTASNDTTTRILIDPSRPGTIQPGSDCFTDNRPPDERRVQVHVGRDTDFNVVFFSTTVGLDSEAVNRFEAALGS